MEKNPSHLNTYFEMNGKFIYLFKKLSETCPIPSLQKS